jgi:hypothetical protein
MKRPGEPPAGYLDLSMGAPINQRQISKRNLSQANAIDEERLE